MDKRSRTRAYCQPSDYRHAFAYDPAGNRLSEKIDNGDNGNHTPGFGPGRGHQRVGSAGLGRAEFEYRFAARVAVDPASPSGYAEYTQYFYDDAGQGNVNVGVLSQVREYVHESGGDVWKLTTDYAYDSLSGQVTKEWLTKDQESRPYSAEGQHAHVIEQRFGCSSPTPLITVKPNLHEQNPLDAGCKIRPNVAMCSPRHLLFAGLVFGLAAASFAAEPPTFSIADFGAKPDGKTLNTSAIAKTIDAAVQAGGGVVRIPSGRWLSGAIELKSNITLYLDNSATLIMSSEPADYPVVFTRWDGIECYNYSGLIYANNADHIAVKGHGVIDGQGVNWWRWFKSEGPARRMLWSLGAAVTNPRDRLFGTIHDSLRPNLIEFTHCETVLIEGVTLKNSPLIAIHPLYSQDVTCRDLYIFSQGPLTDGIDPDSCKKVLIEGCTIDSGGDCVAIKSGRDDDGRRVNIPCREITIRNCHMQRGRAGVAIGSETAGGISDVVIDHCGMRGTDRGIYFKTMRGRGGVVENVKASDLKFIDLQGPCIIIDMQYNPSNPKLADTTTPRIRDITFNNINGQGAKQAVFLRGLPESPIEGLTISSATIKADSGIDAQLVTQTKFNNVALTLSKPDPAFKAEQIGDFTIDTLKASRAESAEPMLALMSCKRVTIKNVAAPAGADAFLQVSGADTQGIELIDCDTLKAKRRLDIDGDVRENAVKD